MASIENSGWAWDYDPKVHQPGPLKPMAPIRPINHSPFLVVGAPMHAPHN